MLLIVVRKHLAYCFRQR